ncbi:YhcN/YlaJ family sporulation lipoprotein [Mesobacillus zeae]|uniref:YhcN/YlaJ family sporulation lipoprotein n=2 Tax=Mesobacillus zeae TaxID=1917180 RepID=A0A398BEC3_9BACI|nr:YhcN/YlaJ family sporulation lipoprotein [Mesobacillus zeae]
MALIAGCNSGQDSESGKDKLIQVKNSTFDNVTREEGKTISRHLENLAESVPGVKGATAVVIGRYAIVGIDLDANLERSEAGVLKYSVAESLKDDPNGANAMIIADPDLNARLKEVAEDIRQGRPGQGIMNELSDITGRVMPEVPADMIDPHPKSGTEEPKKKMNNKDDRRLEQDQQEQSNHYKD